MIKMDRKYYFAYGSNMSLDQMKKRCPDSEFVTIGYIEGYRFVYDGFSRTRNGPVANIITSEKEEKVWGAIFKISEEDERRLDKCEGYPSAYSKTYLTVCDREGNSYNALVYLREPRERGFPSREYEKIVVESAIRLGLPLDYINKYLKVKRE